MNSDFVFRMGATHSICQDYAAAGELGQGGAYAIVSDGCSGSPTTGEPGSPYTDFGARFMVRAAQRYAAGVAAGEFPVERIAIETEGMARQARLPRTSLDATLLIAAAANGQVHVFQTGDGVVAWRRRSGEIGFTSLAFGNNMPFYLSYMLDARLRLQYFEQAQHWTLTEGALGRDRAVSAGDLSLESLVRHTVFDRGDIDLVLLMSDGAESFQLRDGHPVPLEHVLDQMFALKGLTGQFLGRRAGRFLGAFCAERGWKHADDFSVAGIHLGEAL